MGGNNIEQQNAATTIQHSNNS